MFFFHFPKPGAAAAFQRAAKANAETYEDVAKRLQISRGTITKFVAGRPLTPELLRKLVSSFPAPYGKEILIGHLQDEATRAGYDADKLRIVEWSWHGPTLEKLAQLLEENPARVTELTALMDKWKNSRSNT